MRRRLSTWLSSVCLFFGAVAAAGAATWPTYCLPPIFDAGQRLHELPSSHEVSPTWLQLLLRQHELCWRVGGHEEVRVVLAGNSAIYGFPLRAEDTVAALLNQHLEAQNLPAHVFNLGFMFTYQLKDALVISESLPYRPDVIIYGVTLAEFVHLAPIGQLAPFFDANSREMIDLAQRRPAGLSEPANIYRTQLDTVKVRDLRGWRISEVGGLIRAIVRHQAEAVRSYFYPDDRGPSVLARTAATPTQRAAYDCATTKYVFARQYRDWQAWNILSYLEQVRGATGIDVIIVNWPVAHDPVGDCHSVRYPEAALRQYDHWLRQETQARGFTYVDLQDLLSLEGFTDSLHVTAAGQRQIAANVAPALDASITQVLERKRTVSGSTILSLYKQQAPGYDRQP